MEIEAAVDAMRGFVARSDWAGLANKFAQECARVDPGAAHEAMSVDLGSYTAALTRDIATATEVTRPKTRAVLWEFDVDNDWSSSFFFCSTYRPEVANDDDWAADFDADMTTRSVSMPAIAALRPASWNGSDVDAARNALLVARTIACFGRASAAWTGSTPLCAGYHDQSVVFRLVADRVSLAGT